MAANELALANQALLNLGEGRPLTSSDGTIANIVETTDPRTTALIAFYTQGRKMTMRAWPWPFAVKSALLATPTAGTGLIWVDQWDFAYAIPADCLQALRFYTQYGPEDSYPPRFVIGVNAGAEVIFTDVIATEANLEYIEDISVTTRFSEHFDAALAWRLAYDISMPLSVDRELREFALKQWLTALSVAQRVEGNQATPNPTFLSDGSFTQSRYI
ncbi:MAG TPA: hypothetical protein VFH61_07760 [Thermoleophilia bacterium]|nr:hypothetical protein [Thermoleophilia bacterium]